MPHLLPLALVSFVLAAAGIGEASVSGHCGRRSAGHCRRHPPRGTLQHSVPAADTTGTCRRRAPETVQARPGPVSKLGYIQRAQGLAATHLVGQLNTRVLRSTHVFDAVAAHVLLGLHLLVKRAIDWKRFRNRERLVLNA